MTRTRVLITGACGFSAKVLIQHLLKETKYLIYATDIRLTDEFYKDYVLSGVVEDFFIADLRDKESLIKPVHGCKIVFHTASIFDYTADAKILDAVNVRGTLNLLSVCCGEFVKKVVLWSSLAVYGIPTKEGYDFPITEDQDLSPNIKGRYDKSKRYQEHYALKYLDTLKEDGSTVPELTIIRLAPLYGPGTYYGAYIFMKYVQQHSLAGVPRNVQKKSLPLIHVDDVARAAIHLSEIGKYDGECYNVVDDNTLNMLESIRWIAFLTDNEIEILPPTPLVILKPIFKLLAKLSLHKAKKVKTETGKMPVPKLETDTLSYMFGNFDFSNEKLKSTGFKLKYPDRRHTLIDVIDWYNENGWYQPRH